MKANELRLGNWVYHHGIQDGRLIEHKIHESINDVSVSWFEEIPLTEEWLDKFGIKKDEKWNCYWVSHVVFIQTDLYTSGSWDVMFDVDENNSVCLINDGIWYVHELQNLCFALTGKELTTKTINHV